jgi:hypothetical protein
MLKDDSEEFCPQHESDIESELAKWLNESVREAAGEIKGYGNRLSYSLLKTARKRIRHSEYAGLCPVHGDSILPKIMELPDFSADHVGLYVARLIFDLAEKVEDTYDRSRKGIFLCDFLLDEAEKRMPTRGFFHNPIQKESDRLRAQITAKREQTKTYIQKRLADTGYDRMTADELLAGKTPEKAHAAEAA